MELFQQVSTNILPQKLRLPQGPHMRLSHGPDCVLEPIFLTAVVNTGGHRRSV